MRVPFIDLKRSIEPVRENILADWTRCLDQTEFVSGPTVQKLEKELGRVLNAEHAVACANGTDALIIGLQALGVKPGMRVAVPNMTFWAPFEAIVQIGAEPVLVDINPDDLQMNSNAVTNSTASERPSSSTCSVGLQPGCRTSATTARPKASICSKTARNRTASSSRANRFTPRRKFRPSPSIRPRFSARLATPAPCSLRTPNWPK
jgi:hypothetical protein